MNKNDLVASVAGSAGLSKADAAKAVDSVLDNIAGSLSGGQEVRLVGFGTFSVAHRKATQGRTPLANFNPPARSAGARGDTSGTAGNCRVWSKN